MFKQEYWFPKLYKRWEKEFWTDMDAADETMSLLFKLTENKPEIIKSSIQEEIELMSLAGQHERKANLIRVMHKKELNPKEPFYTMAQRKPKY